MAEAMNDMIQEPEFETPYNEEDDLKLQESMNQSSLHHLDHFKNDQHQNPHACTACASTITAATATATATATASNPMKRSPEPVPEPKSKRPFLEDHGYSRLPLPKLQRTESCPLTFTKTTLSETALSKANASSSLPPKGPKSSVLSRTLSEPIYSPVKSLSRSSSCDMGVDLLQEESPSAKRLKRMKERLKEMNSWWGETIREVEDALCTTETEATKGNNGELDDDDDDEEAVSVKKVGECLDLHFKCPCGKGYKILLSEKNCYYKLI